VKRPPRFVWKGKIIGGLFGLMAGPFGIFFGFLIGHLIDLSVESARIRREVKKFLKDPPAASLTLREDGMYSYLCLAGLVSMAGGRNLKSEADVLIDRLGASYPVRGHDLKYLREILEAMDDIDGEPDLQGHANMVKKEKTPDELLVLFTRLAGLGLKTGMKTLSGPVFSIIRTIAEVFALDPKDYKNLMGDSQGNEDDPWAVLGLEPDASIDEVKRVFRVLAAQFHPDGGAALSEVQRRETEEAFKRIRHAYDECLKSFTN
jgi:hypothetical protein